MGEDQGEKRMDANFDKSNSSSSKKSELVKERLRQGTSFRDGDVDVSP
jgi:hypothetical protein